MVTNGRGFMFLPSNETNWPGILLVKYPPLSGGGDEKVIAPDLAVPLSFVDQD